MDEGSRPEVGEVRDGRVGEKWAIYCITLEHSNYCRTLSAIRMWT